MMTNFEKYKDKLLQIANKGVDIALYKGEPVECDDIFCQECDIKNMCREKSKDYELIKWAVSEYRETTLTPEEIRFCEVLPDYWLARDSNSTLWLFADKPYRASDCWDLFGSTPIKINTEKVKASFKFISWQTDAYNTTEILTWEVNK